MLNSTFNTQLTKALDGLVLVAENTTSHEPPPCEIIVEALQEMDADWQYIILVEDADDANAAYNLSMDEAAIWSTQRQWL